MWYVLKVLKKNVSLPISSKYFVTQDKCNFLSPWVCSKKIIIPCQVGAMYYGIINQILSHNAKTLLHKGTENVSNGSKVTHWVILNNYFVDQWITHSPFFIKEWETVFSCMSNSNC